MTMADLSAIIYKFFAYGQNSLIYPGFEKWTNPKDVSKAMHKIQ